MHGHRANGGPYGSSFLAQDNADHLEKNLTEVRLPLNSPTFAFVAAFAFAAAALRRLCAFVSANANVAAGVVPAVAVAAASEYALNKAAKNASFIIGEQKILGAALRNLL